MKSQLLSLLMVVTAMCGFNSLSMAQVNDGANPWGTPIEVSGSLYGTTVYGGAGNYGTLWKLEESTGTYSLVRRFDTDPVNNPEGTHPFGKLLLGSDGFLYGTTTSAYGSFPSGQTPAGTIFRVRPDGSSFSTVFGFPADQASGSSPDSGLIEDPVRDASGNRVFYGVTAYGGTSGTGVIYSLTVSASGNASYAKLYDFPAYTINGMLTYNSVGAQPRCELLLQTAGSTRYLFGSAPLGGTRGAGTVFSLRWSGASTIPTPSTVTMNVEVADGPPGFLTPWGGLLLYTSGAGGSLGKMYGAAANDNGIGGSGCGGFYSLQAGTYTTYPIPNTAETMPTGNQAGVYGTIGLNPRHSTPCLANDGYLYGTSESGRHQKTVGFPPVAVGYGSIYRMSATGGFQVVGWFGPDINPALGLYPHTGLVQASDGYLYGVTSGFQGFFGSLEANFTDTGAIYRVPTNTRGTVVSVHRF